MYYVPNFKNNVEKMIFQTAAAKQNGTKEKHLAFEVTSSYWVLMINLNVTSYNYRAILGAW